MSGNDVVLYRRSSAERREFTIIVQSIVGGYVTTTGYNSLREMLAISGGSPWLS